MKSIMNANSPIFVPRALREKQEHAEAQAKAKAEANAPAQAPSHEYADVHVKPNFQRQCQYMQLHSHPQPQPVPLSHPQQQVMVIQPVPYQENRILHGNLPGFVHMPNLNQPQWIQNLPQPQPFQHVFYPMPPLFFHPPPPPTQPQPYLSVLFTPNFFVNPNNGQQQQQELKLCQHKIRMHQMYQKIQKKQQQQPEQEPQSNKQLSNVTEIAICETTSTITHEEREMETELKTEKPTTPSTPLPSPSPLAKHQPSPSPSSPPSPPSSSAEKITTIQLTEQKQQLKKKQVTFTFTRTPTSSARANHVWRTRIFTRTRTATATAIKTHVAINRKANGTFLKPTNQFPQMNQTISHTTVASASVLTSTLTSTTIYTSTRKPSYKPKQKRPPAPAPTSITFNITNQVAKICQQHTPTTKTSKHDTMQRNVSSRVSHASLKQQKDLQNFYQNTSSAMTTLLSTSTSTSPSLSNKTDSSDSSISAARQYHQQQQLQQQQQQQNGKPRKSRGNGKRQEATNNSQQQLQRLQQPQQQPQQKRSSVFSVDEWLGRSMIFCYQRRFGSSCVEDNLVAPTSGHNPAHRNSTSSEAAASEDFNSSSSNDDNTAKAAKKTTVKSRQRRNQKRQKQTQQHQQLSNNDNNNSMEIDEEIRENRRMNGINTSNNKNANNNNFSKHGGQQQNQQQQQFKTNNNLRKQCTKAAAVRAQNKQHAIGGGNNHNNNNNNNKQNNNNYYFNNNNKTINNSYITRATGPAATAHPTTVTKSAANSLSAASSSTSLLSGVSSSTSSTNSSPNNSPKTSPTGSPTAYKRNTSSYYKRTQQRPPRECVLDHVTIDEQEFIELLRRYIIEPNLLRIYGYPVESIVHDGCIEVFKCLPKHIMQANSHQQQHQQELHYHQQQIVVQHQEIITRQTNVINSNDGLCVKYDITSTSTATNAATDSGRGSGDSSPPSLDSDSSEIGEDDSNGTTIFYSSDGRYQVFSQYDHSLERQCVRCKGTFLVTTDGDYITRDACFYHWGKLNPVYEGEKVNTWQYNCCQGEEYSLGCSSHALHVWTGSAVGLNGPYNDFVYTQPSSTDCAKNKPQKVYALDCEMSFTGRGLEVTKVTLVGHNGALAYETFVRPQAEIVDYNTRFSGITEEDLSGQTNGGTVKTLEQVQHDLLQLIDADTILLGHGLDNDLRVLRIVHKTVVDTSIAFPHAGGFPFRRALRHLMKVLLNRDVQNGDKGHSSFEDSRACLELMVWKLRRELRIDFFD